MTTPHTTYLLDLAARVARPYIDLGADAVLVAGSVAEGLSDAWSDVDMILFYDELPDVAALTAAREAVDGTEHFPLGGTHESGAVLEQFRVEGVACQLVHQTLAAWEAQSATVLADLDVTSPAQKALSGLHGAVVLHGEDLITRLRASAQYPDALAVAMVTANLSVFPLWRLQGSLERRDADLWQRREIIAGFEGILGVLAGVNRTFFSTFQLKRVSRLVDSFEHAPPGTAERIAAALTAETGSAVATLRDVYAETLDIVAAQMPTIDLQGARRALGPPVEPWRLPTDA